MRTVRDEISRYQSALLRSCSQVVQLSFDSLSHVEVEPFYLSAPSLTIGFSHDVAAEWDARTASDESVDRYGQSMKQN